VAAWLTLITLGATGLVLIARHQYRGAHDTNDGLALRPAETASASASASGSPPAPVSVAPIPTPAPTPSEAIAITTPAPVDTVPPTTTTPAAATTTTAAPRPANPNPTAPATTTAAPAPAPVPTAAPQPTTTASGGNLSSESINQAAQRALEGKDKDEKERTRAVQLAWLATQQDPANADAWLTLGAAYENIGKRQQAIEAYRSCARKASAHTRVTECKQLAGIKD